MTRSVTVSRIGLLIVLAGGCRQPPADAPGPTEAVSQPASVITDFVDEQVVSGLNTPSAMAFTPDGRLFVCELGGKVRVIKNGSLLATAFHTVTPNTTSQAGERGLLGIAIDPAFTTNHFVYIYYTANTTPVHNRVSRLVANGDVSTGAETALVDLEDLNADRHNGGGLQFGNDGKLYIGVGENTVGANSQSLGTRLGKLLRINNDGTIPSDNPFFNTVSGSLRSIWAYGLRNPYTFAFQRTTGTLYINDVGNNQFEEIDLGAKGANYDWPNTEGPTTNPGTVTPIFSYANTRMPDCAIVGGTFYDPVTVQFPASYVGQYFFADFCGGWIKKFDPATRTATGFATGISGPVDLDVGPDGFLYYLAHNSGVVGRIKFATNQPPGINAQPASTTVGLGQTATFTVAATGSQPLSYQWQRNTVDIPGATSPSFTTDPVVFSDNGATFRVKVTNAFGNITSSSATLTVLNRQPPTATINQPADGSLYTAGSTVSYSGSATDPNNMTALPASAFTWRIDFHHANHVHPFKPDTTGSTSGTFVPPVNDETSTDVWFRIYLTVKDSMNLTTQIFRDIHPRVSNITLATNPPGLTLTLDGVPVTTPVTVPAVVGMTRAIGAPTPQSQSGTFLSFASWSDSGGANHNIIVPSADSTFTANYSGVTPFLESGGQVVMEAEHFTGTAAGTGAAAGKNWTEQALTGASGTALFALPDTGVNTADTTVGPRRDYAVKFTSTGSYRVWVRLSGPSGGSDSVHMGLNGTAVTFGGQGIGSTPLAWKNTVVTGTPITVNVTTAGVATVNMWMREDGVQVDKILLTKSTTLIPNGTGPAESPHDMPTTPPSAPTNLVAADGVGKSVLTWTDTSNNETGFKIERKLQGSPDTAYAVVPNGNVGANVQTFTDTNVAAGVYTYRVKATNAAGDTASNSDDATVTAPQPPAAPTNLVANDGVGQVSLTWIDNSTDETGFRVERKPQGSPDTSYAVVPNGTLGANVQAFTDTNVVAGSYTYRVLAANAAGDTASNSDDATVTAPQPPAAPTNLVANDGVAQVSLTWTDNSTDETGFRVERKSQGSPDTSYAVVPNGTLGANAQAFTDTNVAAGSYTYRVLATNANGSAASNSDDATVTAPAVSITNLVVNDNLPAGCVAPNCNKDKWSIQSNFQVGAVPFGDRTYTIDSVGGSAILGGPWIRTAADSKNFTGNPLASFTANGSFVYLVIDDRWNGTGTRPPWLTDAAFVDQGFNVVVRQSSTATFPYSVYRKPVTSGSTVNLPPLGGTTAPAYFVIVK
jgi:glucose/arabinose dehydrogenase